MIQCETLKKMRDEKAVSLHFPITHLNSPSIFETRNHMLGSVIKLQGVHFDTESNEVLNQYKRSWHRALLSLDANFSMQVTVHRRKENTFLEGNYNNDFLKEVDRRYQVQFHGKPMYVNDIYIAILRRGLALSKSGYANFLQSLSSKSVKKVSEWKRKEGMQSLTHCVNQLMVSLSDFGPSLLGVRDEKYGYSELLSFLSLYINGSCQVPFRFPKQVASLSYSIKSPNKTVASYPMGHIGAYLSQSRLFFGEAIEYQSSIKEYSRYAAIVSVKRYATQSASIMLDNLLQLDGEFIVTNSFFIESKEVVQRLIGRQRRKLENVNDPAISQISALSEAQDQLASDRIIMGYHHNTIMILSKSIQELNQTVSLAIKSYADAGFIAIRESIGQEPAFWAQIPGNAKMIARSALITSENFVDFCSLHNYRTGFRDQNHLGSAVCLLKTPSQTPYFFNFHAKGNPDNPSKGHATIIGGNGSGKTVAMAFFDAQLSRYGGRTFVFDRDRGLEIYLRASGGYYAILSPDFPDTIHFNPLQLPDTAVNRKFCREWMSQLIKEEGEGVVPAGLAEVIAQCIDYVFEELPKKDRRLSNAAKLLPIDFSRWTHLRRWLRSDGEHPEGEYAYLFDNINDDFEMVDKMGFDMTHFLDVEPRSVLVALTMYLFHRLEQSFDGRLVTVLLDEGWQYLDNSYWMQKLRKWLPTLRKLNCHLVLATQSPSTVVESPIRNMILDNVATSLYFSNPQAVSSQYCDGFNLTQSEFQCIKEGNPNFRYFLLKQEHESCLCQLDLSMMKDILPILSANKANLLLLDKLRQQYGDDPKQWLPIFQKGVRQ